MPCDAQVFGRLLAITKYIFGVYLATPVGFEAAAALRNAIYKDRL